MTQEDLIIKQLARERALSFLSLFLEDFPNADLFLVGGAVRDILMGRHTQRKDYDFVIRGLEVNELESWLATQGSVDLVGRTFGVLKFMPKGFTARDIEYIDIALPRTEHASTYSLGGYKDFDVQSDPQLPITEDLSRRDFTVNALAFNLRSKTLIDPFHGMQHLLERRIQTVGTPEERFEEDLSRMLRAIRFAAELHFSIEADTLAAIRAQGEAINRQRALDGHFDYIVPRETVGRELAKALERNPAGAIQWLEASALMGVLFPDIERIAEVNSAYLLPLGQLKQHTITTAVCLLLRAIDPEQIPRMLTSTGLTTLPKDSSWRIEASDIQWVVARLHPPLTLEDVQQMPGADFEKWFFNERGEELLQVLALLGKSALVTAVHDRRQDIRARWLVEPGETIAPLLSGQDVLSAGIEEGPKVRKILEDCRSAQLDGRLMTREEAQTWLEQKTNKKS